MLFLDPENCAQIAQLVEHTLGKGEVGSSNLLLGSIRNTAVNREIAGWRAQRAIIDIVINKVFLNKLSGDA